MKGTLVTSSANGTYGPLTSFIIAGVLGILLVMVSPVNENEVSDITLVVWC